MIRSTNNTTKQTVMIVTLVVAMLAAVIWSALYLLDRRAAAQAAAADLADSRALIHHIEALRRRPVVADVHELGAADLSRRIETAAATAKFDDGAVERIEPQATRRVGETNYREVPTQVRLHRVTLRQIFTFLQALSTDRPDSALRVRDIRLTAPRGEENSDRWSVETTLSYMIYAPTVAAK